MTVVELSTVTLDPYNQTDTLLTDDQRYILQVRKTGEGQTGQFADKLIVHPLCPYIQTVCPDADLIGGQARLNVNGRNHKFTLFPKCGTTNACFSCSVAANVGPNQPGLISFLEVDQQAIDEKLSRSGLKIALLALARITQGINKFLEPHSAYRILPSLSTEATRHSALTKEFRRIQVFKEFFNSQAARNLVPKTSQLLPGVD